MMDDFSPFGGPLGGCRTMPQHIPAALGFLSRHLPAAMGMPDILRATETMSTILVDELF